MNFSQAKELVKKHPKRLGDFVRERVKPGFIEQTSAVNFVRYNFDSCTGATWRYGYSIGDGKLYGHKIVKCDGGAWVDQPSLEIVVADKFWTNNEDGTFDINIDFGPEMEKSRQLAANTRPSVDQESSKR